MKDILVTYRYAAGGDEQVAVRQHSFHSFRHSGGGVGGMAAKRRYAKLRQPGGEKSPVGAVDLPGREGLPGLHHFVPGGEQPHFGPASHGYLCEAGAGQYAKGSGVQPGACREQQAARSVVLTLIDIIFIRGEGGVDSYRVTQISVLLAEYAVTALGQHGSRHDADGLSGQKG